MSKVLSMTPSAIASRAWRAKSEENKLKQRAAVRAWMERNKDKFRAYKRKWKADNPEAVALHRKRRVESGKVLEEGRRYRKANAEKERRRQQKWRQSNPDKTAAARKRRVDSGKVQAEARAYYAANKQRIIIKGLQWSRRNPLARKASKLRWYESGKGLDSRHRRIANLRGSVNTDCTEAIALLRQSTRCCYCECDITGKVSIDHVVPINRGGSHTPDNLAAACASCNSSKRDLLLSEWKGRLQQAA